MTVFGHQDGSTCFVAWVAIDRDVDLDFAVLW